MNLIVEIRKLEVKVNDKLEEIIISTVLARVSARSYGPRLLLRVLAKHIDLLAPTLLDGGRPGFDMLEYRGDKVLWVVVTMLISEDCWLIHESPTLIRLVAQVLTSNRILNCILKRLHLWPGMTGKKRAADMMEALFGRIDRMLGFAKAKEVIADLLRPLIGPCVVAGMKFLKRGQMPTIAPLPSLLFQMDRFSKEHLTADFLPLLNPSNGRSRHDAQTGDTSSQRDSCRRSRKDVGLMVDRSHRARRHKTRSRSRSTSAHGQSRRHRTPSPRVSRTRRQRSTSSDRDVCASRYEEKKHRRSDRGLRSRSERSRSPGLRGRSGADGDRRDAESSHRHSNHDSSRHGPTRTRSTSTSPRRSGSDRASLPTRAVSSSTEGSNDAPPSSCDEMSPTHSNTSQLIREISSTVAGEFRKLQTYIRLPSAFDPTPDMRTLTGVDRRLGRELLNYAIAAGLESGVWSSEQLSACAASVLVSALASDEVLAELARALDITSTDSDSKAQICTMLVHASRRKSVEYICEAIVKFYAPVIRGALRLARPLSIVYAGGSLETARKHIVDVVDLYKAGHSFDSGLTPISAVLTANGSALEGLFTHECLHRSRLV